MGAFGLNIDAPAKYPVPIGPGPLFLADFLAGVVDRVSFLRLCQSAFLALWHSFLHAI